MTGPGWAYPPGDPPAPTVLDELVAAPPRGARRALLDELGAALRASADDELFMATADNLVRVDGTVTAVHPRPAGVVPLDRGASAARVVWYLAASMVERGALGAEAPDRSIDEHALALAGTLGLTVTSTDLERFLRHEGTLHAPAAAELATRAASTARSAAASGALDEDALRLALTRAYDDLTEARRDRDRAERAAVELEATRALARRLGDQLERDEWIRARLRNVKATRPARAAIAAKRRLTGRSRDA